MWHFAQNSAVQMDEGVRVCAPLRGTSRPVSRVLSRIIIHLDRESPPGLERPTRKRRGPRHGFPIWSCSGWGLPCRSRYRSRGALLPHHFTLTGRSRRYTFCCTGRRLAPPRRYLAPCPVEPGLSSSPRRDPRLSGRLGGNFTGNRLAGLTPLSVQINFPCGDSAPASGPRPFPPAA